MNDGSQSLVLIIVFAMVAVFLALRLYSILGRRTGDEKPSSRFGGPPEQPGMRRMIDVTPVRPAPVPAIGPARMGLSAITQADPSFDPQGFVSGAKAAFAMILQAFGQGDETTLRGLLADEVFQSFATAIRDRKAAGEICANSLEATESAEIVSASLEGNVAEITVRFASRQRVVTRNAAGAVIEGDPDHAVEHIDLWTFSRNLRSRDPNWLLAATRNLEE